ncbi:hypothetical protein [Longimicrobium sp.]|uniref:hypothetical protein n=1 Tax=Longimicrobium sp. TaxID=2029185 RepID=UPI002CCF1BE4|nr:hypothetical protein [Longimicrobium sp.]HSU16295.1 hypothetical protein [Longimicrobium sp.]
MKRIASLFLVVLAACNHRGTQHENPGYAGKLDSLGIPHRTLQEKMKTTDLGEWPKDGAANGITASRVTGGAVGLPREAARGARFVSVDDVRKLDVARQGTGLFIVGTDYVPRELPELLQAKGLTARPDGSLVDRNGEPVALFINNETYRVQGGERQASLGGKLLDFLVPSAYAASPFAWRCFSFSPWALYHGGFHRWYEAGTSIAAYGADGGGGCSGGSPLTNIDFLQARAEVGSPGAQNFCFHCPTQSAYDTWDVGYFWPAHGTPTTTHSGVWADGSFSFSRTANLSW